MATARSRRSPEPWAIKPDGPPSLETDRLAEGLALIRQFEQSPAKALAATLLSWLEPIVRMWRFTKSNGITEGFHTKMEMLSCRAFGFRNFENYRMRVLAQCGWNGVINRV
ncbi:hypothetical protein GCM10027565_08940 [Bordetella tumulicola]